MPLRPRRLEFSDAFAIVLQRHRLARKLSRQTLSEKAGLHQTYIGLIERGLSNPSLDTATRAALSLSLDQDTKHSIDDQSRSGRRAGRGRPPADMPAAPPLKLVP
jgi:transcriptional regulator with XRE-family HTH domain